MANNIPEHIKAGLPDDIANDPTAVYDPVDDYPEVPDPDDLSAANAAELVALLKDSPSRVDAVEAAELARADQRKSVLDAIERAREGQ